LVTDSRLLFGDIGTRTLISHQCCGAVTRICMNHMIRHLAPYGRVFIYVCI